MSKFTEMPSLLLGMTATMLGCWIIYIAYRYFTQSNRSKKFNKLADPLREKVSSLRVMVGDPNAYPTWLEAGELQPLLGQCDFFLKRKLLKAFDNYSDSILFTCSFTSSSCYEVLDETKLQRSLATLLNCLQPK